MAETENLTESDSSVIRHNIDETRAALSSKIDALEHEVKETAADAKASVEHRVDEVKQAFNLRYQVSRNPWPFVAGAAALGFLGGAALAKRSRGSGSRMPGWLPEWSKRNGGSTIESVFRSDGRARTDGELTLIDQTMQTVKSVALGVMLSALREVAKGAPHVAEMTSDVSQSLGGQSVKGRSLRTPELH